MIFNYFLNQLPMVEVKLINNNRHVRLFALIDTGADYTLFSKAIAKELGLVIEKGEMKILEAAAGNVVGYLHPLTAIIADKEMKILACFCENDLPENILGRKDIINNFTLIMDKFRFELKGSRD